MAQGTSLPRSGPDLGGGEGEWEASEEMEPESGRRRGGFDAGSWNDHKLDQTGEPLRIAPGRQRSDVVGSDEPAQGGSRVPPGVVIRRVDAVRDAAPADLLVVDLDAVHSGKREPEHAEAKVRIGRGGSGLERGLGGWNDDEPVEGKLFQGCFGHQEVTQVDGIKGPAVKTHAVHTGAT